jgi:hypothetical protein
MADQEVVAFGIPVSELGIISTPEKFGHNEVFSCIAAGNA